MSSKRISVITPVLNRRAMLEDAINSVRAQKYQDIEHIVVDGGSTDGAAEWLTAQPDVVLLQDRRRGLYDAINLGLQCATGDYVGLLNSDDLYAPGAFAVVSAAFEANPDADAICGFAELFNMDHVLACYRNAYDLALDAHAALLGHCITNARFFRRSVFDRVGHFSTSYPRSADREFLVRCSAAGIRSVPVPTLLYRYRSHAGSLTFSSPMSRNENLSLELLNLAQDLQCRRLPRPDILAKARVLEGRCVAVLAARLLQRGNVRQAAALFTRNGRISVAPLYALVAAVFHRLRD
jgi:glycosyltransferase involved in cell wall biosynthesis